MCILVNNVSNKTDTYENKNIDIHIQNYICDMCTY